jgi:rod shape-determining protein MreD
MIKKIFFIIGVILLGLLQVSFFNSFEMIRYYTNIVLVLAILITVTIGYQRGLLFAILTGLLLDCFSSFSFGTITVALLIPIVVIYYIFRKWLAHKSIYSLMLVIILSTLIYNLLLWLLTNTFYWLNWSDLAITFNYRFISMIGGQLIGNITIVVLLYLIVSLVLQKIKSRFLISFQT